MAVGSAKTHADAYILKLLGMWFFLITVQSSQALYTPTALDNSYRYQRSHYAFVVSARIQGDEVKMQISKLIFFI